METTIEVRELAGKVSQLEQEFADLRQQVRELKREKSLPSNATIHVVGQDELNHSMPLAGATSAIRWADQSELSQAFNKLFADLGIQEKPAGIETLQEMMGQAGLPKNALSRGIIEMRDE
jgi:hypothetical protein